MAGLRWIPPTRADDAAWLDLLRAIEAVDQRGETYVTADLDDEWASVWAHPDTDARFVWDGDELVAFAWLKAMPGEREWHQVECWGGVRPDRRRQGLGGQILDWQVARGRELADGFDPRLATRIGLGALDGHHGLLALARSRGFELVRRFLELIRPAQEPLGPARCADGVEVLDWDVDRDEAVRLAHSDAFADHWGSEPRTEEQWRQWYTGHRGFRPDLSVVALADGDVAGFVLCAAYPQDWQCMPREAWITTVGTPIDRRRRGVARLLVTEVLHRIAISDTGFERAILGVDEANPTGALRLYRSLGFVDERVSNSLAIEVRAASRG